MAIHNFTMLIRLHSWWHSTGVPKRTFIIGQLPYDIDEDHNPVYDRVGLIEFGYDDTIWIDIDTFKKEIDLGEIKAMNCIPNIHPKPNEKKPNP